MKTKVIFELDKNVKREFKTFCAARGLTMTEVLVRLVAALLSGKIKLDEAAEG